MSLLNAKVSVIIPALNEETAITRVISDIPRDLVTEIIVADNGSTDRTAEAAKNSGARVVHEPEKGYGAACLAGMAAAHEPDIIVFIDGDYSDYPERINELIRPIQEDIYDFVLATRMGDGRQENVLTPQACFGNHLATWLIKILYHHQYHDLGPFRAIRADALNSLEMKDRNFGWTVEMQIKAVQKGLRIKEIPLPYRPRIGTSKVSGTVSGSIKAGYKILYTIAKLILKN